MKTSIKQKGLIALSFLTTLGISIGLYYHLNKTSIPKEKKKEQEKISLGINEPIKDGLPFEKVKFQTSEGLVFHRPNGTHIEIPANSIVDNKGNPITGEVEFRFREMQNAKEIFLSGIPMQMNSDRTTHLQSLGMVEMRVFQDDQELQLKKGSLLNVDIAAAKKPDENFNLWVLSDNNTWEQKGSFETVSNVRREEALKKLPKKPKKPKKPKQDLIFQLASDRRMPHLKVWENVDWKLVEGKKEKEVYHAMRINWDKITIEPINEKKKLFKLTFVSTKEDHKWNSFKDSISITATPEVKKKDMKKLLAQYDLALKDYAEVLEKREKEEARILQERALLNSFSASGFGIYNIDKIEQTKILAKINASFDFQKNIDRNINNVQLIMICNKQNTVLTYYPTEWESLPVLDDEIELVALLPNGQYAYVSSKEFNTQIRMKDIHPSFENKRFFHSTSISKDELRRRMS